MRIAQLLALLVTMTAGFWARTYFRAQRHPMQIQPTLQFDPNGGFVRDSQSISIPIQTEFRPQNRSPIYQPKPPVDPSQVQSNPFQE